MKVIKRDGRAVEYNSSKINIAIEKANKEVSSENRATIEEINEITNYIESLDKKRILVEDIQDIIEQKLMEIGRYDLAKKYIVYRYTRALVRKQNTTDESILGLIKNNNNIHINGEQNPIVASVQRDLIAGEVSKDLTKRILLPEKISKADEDGIIKFHDTDYFLQPIINSCNINISDMLHNGTVINGQKIETPKSLQVACIITTQIIATIASNQYGEQSVNIKHLGKYLRKSYEKIKNDLEDVNKELKQTCKLSDEIIEKIAQKRLKNELISSVQTLEYQINTLITNYRQIPKVTLVIELEKGDEYYIENRMIYNEILNQRIETNNFNEKKSPKLICIFDDEELINKAKKCENKNVEINPENIEKYKKEGFFNQGIVSVNLLKIAQDSKKDENEFWKLLDERLEICYEALMCRHYALLGTFSDVSPIHWQNGAISRLKSNEKIDGLLKDGFSNITLGYLEIEKAVDFMFENEDAMFENVNYMWKNADATLRNTNAMLENVKVNDEEKKKFANRIVKFLQDKVLSWKKMTGICFEVVNSLKK